MKGAIKPAARMTPEELLTALRSAWERCHRASCAEFGIVTAPVIRVAADRQRQRGTTFRWRNYLTGENGFLAFVPEPESLAAAATLLSELQQLRKPQLVPRRGGVAA